MKYFLFYFSLFLCIPNLISNTKFKGPAIMEIAENMHSMVSTDLDNDGRRDILLANNDDLKLELLYQRTSEELKKEAKENINSNLAMPVYNDLPFLKQQLLIGEIIYAINTVDFDNDGMTDIIYTGKKSKISVLFQTKKKVWDNSWSDNAIIPIEYANTVAVGDINNDKKQDFAILTKRGIKVFLSNGSRDKVPAYSYAVTVDDAQNLKLVDINKDGLLDLVFFSKFHPYSMRFRLQQSEDLFGPEIAVPVKTSSTD